MLRYPKQIHEEIHLLDVAWLFCFRGKSVFHEKEQPRPVWCLPTFFRGDLAVIEVISYPVHPLIEEVLVPPDEDVLICVWMGLIGFCVILHGVVKLARFTPH